MSYLKSKNQMKQPQQINGSYVVARKQIEELASYIDRCYSEERNREKQRMWLKIIQALEGCEDDIHKILSL